MTPLFRPLLFVAVLLLRQAQCCQAQVEPDARLRAIREHWRQRQAELPAVAYAWTATSTWSRGAFAETADELETAPNPPADVTSTGRRSLLLDFAHNRHNAVWNDSEYSNLKGVHYRLHCNNVCDGQTVHSRIFENSDPSLRPNQAKTHVDLLIQKGTVPAGVFHRGDCVAVLMAHGSLAYDDDGPRPGKLIPSTEFKGLTYHREDEYEGRKCAVVTTSRTNNRWTEFWVDPDLNDAVVRVVIQAKHPHLIVELGYMRVNGVLVLTRWSRRQYDIADGRLRFQEDCQATAVETSPKLADVAFRIQPATGMAVKEEVYFIDERGRSRARQRFYELDRTGIEIELDEQTLLPTRP